MEPNDEWDDPAALTDTIARAVVMKRRAVSTDNGPLYDLANLAIDIAAKRLAELWAVA